jgi:hypothetical protein
MLVGNSGFRRRLVDVDSGRRRRLLGFDFLTPTSVQILGWLRIQGRSGRSRGGSYAKEFWSLSLGVRGQLGGVDRVLIGPDLVGLRTDW